MELRERFRGSLLGLAIGDALGYPTEFVSSVDSIRARWGAEGVTGFVSSGHHPPGTFTDDTQMSIAVARALIRAGHADLDTFARTLGEEFVAWSRSPENNRSPGGACLSGCSRLRQGSPWRQAGVRDSKGCGAAMRAAPIGLFYHADDVALVRSAAAQSALTHRHPTGYASSVAAAAAVAWATRAEPLEGLVDFVRACVERLDEDLLAEMGCDPELIGRYGVQEMLEALGDVDAALGEETDDVCQLLGGGWIGEEAVACALWCVLKGQGDFRASVLRGANSSGDSDSIACIAGSIAGALGGYECLPEDWVRDVEKAARLDSLARLLFEVASSGVHVAEPPEELDFFGVKRATTLATPPSWDADAPDDDMEGSQEADDVEDSDATEVDGSQPEDAETTSTDEDGDNAADDADGGRRRLF